MSEQITITLPDRIYERVNEWASFTQQNVTDMVAVAIDAGLPALSTKNSEPVSSMDDESVLSLSEAKLDKKTGKKLNVLLYKQREGELTETEREELMALMQNYHELWVRQSQALAEAVRRGLRPPLVF